MSLYIMIYFFIRTKRRGEAKGVGNFDGKNVSVLLLLL